MLLAANGHGLNDFAGHAAGIMATDNANVTIDNATHAGQQGKNLNVVLENADVAGVISAGTQSHVNVKPGEVITKENYTVKL